MKNFSLPTGKMPVSQNGQPSTVNRQQTSKMPVSQNGQPSTVNRQQTSKMPVSQNGQPSTVNRQQTKKLLWTGVHLATWSWLSLSLASTPASAAFPNYDLVKQRDYERCASSLNEAGITPERASEACGMAVRPRVLSDCVSRIGEYTSITSEDALSGCIRVRRPQEFANCVVYITEGAEDAVPFDVLDSCRRSLLPEKHSFCVVGLKQSDIDLPTSQLLETCLNPPETFLDLGLGTNQ